VSIHHKLTYAKWSKLRVLCAPKSNPDDELD
jgi:hypothetical protein